jgi:hypothetical protein
MNYFPGLTSNHHPPDLCFLSSWDYRRELWHPTETMSLPLMAELSLLAVQLQIQVKQHARNTGWIKWLPSSKQEAKRMYVRMQTLQLRLVHVNR